MVGSFSFFLKVCLFGNSSLCKADVAACRGEIRMKLRGKSWFDLMQHLILKQWNAGTGFSQKKLTKDSVFCYLALTDRGNWNASWCRRLSFFGSIRSNWPSVASKTLQQNNFVWPDWKVWWWVRGRSKITQNVEQWQIGQIVKDWSSTRERRVVWHFGSLHSPSLHFSIF